MVGAPFQRHRSWFENVAIWLTACVACALMLASFESLWFFFTDSFSDAWREFAWCFLRALVAVAALFSALGLGTTCLPERRALRWPALALVIVAAAALGWFAEDGLTLLVSGARISDGERPYTLHTMFVLALLVGTLGEYRWASLRAAALLHEAELNRLRLESELAAG